MPSAEFTYIDTPPVVEGGSYERELADGRIETGTGAAGTTPSSWGLSRTR